MVDGSEFIIYSPDITKDGMFEIGAAIKDPTSAMGYEEKQVEEIGAYDYLSASPFFYDNGHHPRIRYDREELLNLQFIVNKEEQLNKWNGIMCALGPVGSELGSLENTGQQNKDGRRQRSRKKKEAANKMETISLGSVLLLKSEEQCYEELPCSSFLGMKVAELRKSSNCSFEEERDYESSEDEFDSLLKPALFVEGEPNFGSGSPEDGFEYLRRVRKNQCYAGTHTPISQYSRRTGVMFGRIPGNTGQQNKDSRHQRSRRKKEAANKMETISPGLVLLLKSEEQCYEELPCSSFLGMKVAELRKSSNCSFEEERDYESSEDEFDSLLKPTLFVEGEPNFGSGSPEDGFEYLRRVRWEANQFPRVKVANLDVKKLNERQTSYMPNIPPVLDCSIDLLPSKDWEREFLADFSNLRMALAKANLSSSLQLTSLPSRRDKAAWERFCFGTLNRLLSDEESCSQEGENEKAKDDILDDVDLEINGTSQEYRTNDTSDSQVKDLKVDSPGEIKYATSPLLPVILSLDEVTRATLFMYHVSWLESISSLSKDRAVWLFALCAVLGKPLDAQMCASVRALLRKCASLRAASTKDDEVLPMLNILITIAGKYYGQAEDLMSKSSACNCTEVTTG